MEISTDKKNDWFVIIVDGRLDTVTAPEFDSFVSSQVGTSYDSVAVDMSKISYLSSAGLR